MRAPSDLPLLDMTDVTLADGTLLPSADPSARVDAVIVRGSLDRVRIFVHQMKLFLLSRQGRMIEVPE